MVPHLVVTCDYTPEEAHSRVFATRGVSIRVTNAGKNKIVFWGGQLVLSIRIRYSHCLL